MSSEAQSLTVGELEQVLTEKPNDTRSSLNLSTKGFRYLQGGARATGGYVRLSRNPMTSEYLFRYADAKGAPTDLVYYLPTAEALAATNLALVAAGFSKTQESVYVKAAMHCNTARTAFYEDGKRYFLVECGRRAPGADPLPNLSVYPSLEPMFTAPKSDLPELIPLLPESPLPR